MTCRGKRACITVGNQMQCAYGCSSPHPPLVDLFMEGREERDFGLDGDGHVILHGVQSPQDQVKHANGITQGVGELLDDHGKAGTTGNGVGGRCVLRCLA